MLVVVKSFFNLFVYFRFIYQLQDFFVFVKPHLHLFVINCLHLMVYNFICDYSSCLFFLWFVLSFISYFEFTCNFTTENLQSGYKKRCLYLTRLIIIAVNDGITLFIMKDNKVDGKIFVDLQILKIVFATIDYRLFSGLKSFHISLKAFWINFEQVVIAVK